MTDLNTASTQWANRPDDERFSTPEELLAAVQNRKACDAEVEIAGDSLDVVDRDTDLALVYRPVNAEAPTSAALTAWSFQQVCTRVKAPAAYLATLPTYKAADLLSYGLTKLSGEGVCNVLVNGGGTVRSLMSDSYERVWDVAIAERLIELRDAGWRVPPARPAREGQAGARAATEADVLSTRGGGGGLYINVGDMIAPAGLYAGDRDLFAFMVNEDARLEDGTPGGLSRGFFIENSEVGAKGLRVTSYLYRHVCGNHIVWGAENVRTLAVRHVGMGPEAFWRGLEDRVRSYMESGFSADEARIKAAQRFTLGDGRDKVADFLYSRSLLGKRAALKAYDRAEQDGETPTTAWGLAQGITRLSQDLTNADRRNELDKAAGRIIDLAA